MGNLAGALSLRSEEAALIAELQAGSEEAFAWLIAHYHQPIYSLLARMLHDRADAADMTQEVFVKVFRGVGHFHGESSLRTWIYRIALHEASNQRRWWMRHKHQEIPIAQDIAKRFAAIERQQNIGELKIKISGCINACGHHHAGHIGILGVDKKGVEFYQLVLGGSGAEDASIGTIMGPGFGEHEIGDAVERVVNVYLAERKDGERFLDTYRRIGMEKFKAAAYQEAAAA